jgi:hypothetical protein
MPQRKQHVPIAAAEIWLLLVNLTSNLGRKTYSKYMIVVKEQIATTTIRTLVSYVSTFVEV